jgi:hypothetical protein
MDLVNGHVILHLGVDMTNDSWTNPRFKRHARLYIVGPPMQNIVHFTKYSKSGLTQGQ